MNIRKIDDNEKMKFIDLLLIADEQVSMIERYRGSQSGLRCYKGR